MTLNFNANWNKILIFILCILLVFNVVVGSAVTADASITLTASTIAVIGAALVACGFTFQNSAQMSAACEHLWNNLTTEQRNFFVNSGLTYLDYASSTEPFIIKLTKDVCIAIGSWLGSLGATADSATVIFPSLFEGTVTLQRNYLISSGFVCPVLFGDASKDSSVAYDCRTASDFLNNPYILNFYQVPGTPIFLTLYTADSTITNSSKFYLTSLYCDGVNYDSSVLSCGYASFDLSVWASDDGSSLYLKRVFTSGSNKGASRLWGFDNFVTLDSSVSIPWTGDYAPSFGGTKELSDETDIIVPGGMVKDNELDDGVVSVMNPDSVRSADVPDVITGTGSIVGEGTGTGIFESIGKWILNIPILGDILKAIIDGFTGLIEFLQELLETIVTAISSAITSVIEFVRDLFIPKNFTWDKFMNDVVAIVSPPASVDFRSFVNSTPIPDVTMELKGNTYTVVDNSYLRKNISTFRGIIGAFLAVLLVIYNYNMFMRLMGYSGFSFNDSRKNEKGGNDE